MDEHWTVGSAFRQATIDTRQLIARRIADQSCTFLTSSNYMNAPSAKLGYLISSSLAAGGGGATTYRTFLINSGVEALSGALKLARHTSVRHGRDNGGWVLLLDTKGVFAPFLDPTGKGVELALTPHVVTVNGVRQAMGRVAEHEWSAVVLVRDGDLLDLQADSELAELLDRIKSGGALTVLCDTELCLGDSRLFTDPVGADVVVYGENLADRQVPFGCFAMTEQAYEIWNNDVDCFAHTSTFGGNAFCAEVVLASLERHGLIVDQHHKVFADIDADKEQMQQYWCRHLNPTMAKIAAVFGMDLEVVRASGGRIWLDDGREILDCSGGFGSNLRGHNPPGVQEQVLARHDPEHDYFGEFEALLTGRTVFDKAFPAVSGATAVDTAVTLAMLAHPQRNKVVSFTGNFGGKSLFGINLSKHGPHLTETDKEAFRPYYRELVYIDPCADNALDTLREVLTSGDVALVWFEVIQGGMCEVLPKPILAVVDELREVNGYFVGVDEVLTGGWRTGENYLAHENLLGHADVVSVGKTMTDMLFPMSAALCTQEVYDRAMTTDPGQVNLRCRHFRNSLGAHISLHALRTVAEPERHRQAIAAQRLIEEALRKLVAESAVFEAVGGRGALLRLVLDHKYFPFHHRSKLGNMLEMATAHLIFQRCGVFVFLLRFLHRVSTTEQDARELAVRLDSGMRGIRPRHVYRYALSRIVSRSSPKLAGLIAGKLAHPRYTSKR